MSPVVGVIAIDIVIFIILAVAYSFTGDIKPALLYTNTIIIYSWMGLLVMLCCIAAYHDYIKRHDRNI